MKTAILDYSTGDVDIINIPDDLDTNEKVQEWLEEAGGYRLKDINYMTNVQHVNIL